MWSKFVIFIQTFWHNLALVYGYHEVLLWKERIDTFSILGVGMILMHFINGWFYTQYKRSDKIKGMAAQRMDGETVSNPHTLTDLLDTYSAIIHLKLHPETLLRPKDTVRARIIMYILVTLFVIFVIVGFITASIVTLPYGGVRHVY